MKINGINISIQESHYNKSEIQTDGVTHKIDINKTYPLYMLEMHKVYFNCNSKEEVIRQIINDLEITVQKLKDMSLNKDLNSSSVER